MFVTVRLFVYLCVCLQEDSKLCSNNPHKCWTLTLLNGFPFFSLIFFGSCGRLSWLNSLTASFRAHVNIVSLLTYLLRAVILLTQSDKFGTVMHQYRLQRFLLVFSTSQSLCCCCCCTVLWRHGISQWVTWHGYTAAGARKAVERTCLSVRTIKCLIAHVHLVTMSFLYVIPHYVQLIGPNCIFLPRAFHLYANTDFGI